jgi:hypothetical protein
VLHAASHAPPASSPPLSGFFLLIDTRRIAVRPRFLLGRPVWARGGRLPVARRVSAVGGRELIRPFVWVGAHAARRSAVCHMSFTYAPPLAMLPSSRASPNMCFCPVWLQRLVRAPFYNISTLIGLSWWPWSSFHVSRAFLSMGGGQLCNTACALRTRVSFRRLAHERVSRLWFGQPIELFRRTRVHQNIFLCYWGTRVYCSVALEHSSTSICSRPSGSLYLVSGGLFKQ